MLVCLLGEGTKESGGMTWTKAMETAAPSTAARAAAGTDCHGDGGWRRWRRGNDGGHGDGGQVDARRVRWLCQSQPGPVDACARGGCMRSELARQLAAARGVVWPLPLWCSVSVGEKANRSRIFEWVRSSSVGFGILDFWFSYSGSFLSVAVKNTTTPN